MTQQQAKELLPIITAFAEGKEIQYKSRSGPINKWTKVCDTSWSNDILEFRIKPEPREYWIIESQDISGYIKRTIFASKPTIADLAVYGNTIKEVMHVKEVL